VFHGVPLPASKSELEARHRYSGVSQIRFERSIVRSACDVNREFASSGQTSGNPHIDAKRSVDTPSHSIALRSVECVSTETEAAHGTKAPMADR